MKTKFLILFAVIFMAQIYLASALTIGSVTSTPSEVQPGEKFSLDLKIENDLNSDIENVIVTLDLSSNLPFAPYQSSNEVQIDKIDEDDDEKADFDLSAFSNAVSGTYLIPVKISYDILNDSVENESLGMVSVIVNAKPKIDLSSEGGVLIKGTEGTISLRIINSGLGDAKFLSVDLSSITGMEITSSDKVYLGNIDSNDFDTADFNVFISTNAQSSVNLPIQITYTDSRNNEITEDKIITVKTYTVTDATELGLISRNNTAIIIPVVIGVVILFFGYRIIRKRIRNKRAAQ